VRPNNLPNFITTGLLNMLNASFTRWLTCGLVVLCWTSLVAADVLAQKRRVKTPLPKDTVDIVVQGALDWELQPLLAALEHKEQIQIAAWTFWRGRIAGKRVVVSRTEVGPINAVAATTLAIERFHPKLILNQGTAGANDPELKVYDIVVGAETVDYGAFRSTHAEQGTGINQERWAPLTHKLRLEGKERIEFKRFAGDEAALKVALATPYARGRLRKGVVGAAFEYNRELDRLLWVRKTYGTDSEDMESAFAAGTAAGFKVPFLAVRIISDSEFYAPELKEAAGEYCAAFVVEVIKQMNFSGKTMPPEFQPTGFRPLRP
jgi:adenosylhomocysteine nucleosidase